jgi:DNA repair protein RadD
MQDRWYQTESVQAIWSYFINGGRGNPVVALPTGTGKSVVIAKFIASVIKAYLRSQKIVVATHKKELVVQNAGKLRELCPDLRIGINSSSIGRRDTKQNVIFAGIDSVMNMAREFGHVDLLIVDECHLVDDKEGSRYMKFIAALMEINPKLKVIGLSATPWRSGLGYIWEGGVFTDCCYNAISMESFNRFVDEGYLSLLIAPDTDTIIDLSGVRIRAGEYKADELAAASDVESITRGALTESVARGNNPDDYRYSWMAFGSSVKHCQNIARMLNEEFGIPTTIVYSGMPGGDSARDKAIEDFKAGKYRCIVSQGVLTTGFDHPPIDLIIMLRATMSSLLWVQMLGRGTRPYAGWLAAFPYIKINCMVLDFARNVLRLGPINDPLIPRKRNKDGPAGEIPVRVCGECGAFNHASARRCSMCGCEFPVMVKIQERAGGEELIKRERKTPKEYTYKIDAISYGPHDKKGKPVSIKVTYSCGHRMFSEYVCPAHEGGAGIKARNWWTGRTSTGTPPGNAEGFLSRTEELRVPSHIKVMIGEGHPDIAEYDFTGSNFGTELVAPGGYEQAPAHVTALTSKDRLLAFMDDSD